MSKVCVTESRMARLTPIKEVSKKGEKKQTLQQFWYGMSKIMTEVITVMLLMKQQSTYNMSELLGYLKSPMWMAPMMCSMMRLYSCSCCVMKLNLTTSMELAVSSTIFSRSKSQWSILLTVVLIDWERTQTQLSLIEITHNRLTLKFQRTFERKMKQQQQQKTTQSQSLVLYQSRHTTSIHLGSLSYGVIKLLVVLFNLLVIMVRGWCIDLNYEWLWCCVILLKSGWTWVSWRRGYSWWH